MSISSGRGCDPLVAEGDSLRRGLQSQAGLPCGEDTPGEEGAGEGAAEVTACVAGAGLWGRCPLCHLVKKRYLWVWGLERQAHLEKAKLLGKQMIALGISQAGLRLS